MRGRVRNVRAEIGAGPAKAGVDIDFATDRLISQFVRLGKVERQVSRVATSADDPGLIPGNWVFFDGRIGCHVVDIEPKPGAVLFCQVPSARRRSVLLHGSAIHLMDRRQASEATAVVPVAFSATEEVPRIIRDATADTADAFGRRLVRAEGARNRHVGWAGGRPDVTFMPSSSRPTGSSPAPVPGRIRAR